MAYINGCAVDAGLFEHQLSGHGKDGYEGGLRADTVDGKRALCGVGEEGEISPLLRVDDGGCSTGKSDLSNVVNIQCCGGLGKGTFDDEKAVVDEL